MFFFFFLKAIDSIKFWLYFSAIILILLSHKRTFNCNSFKHSGRCSGHNDFFWNYSFKEPGRKIHLYRKWSYIESCLWTGQISAVQLHFLMIASFLTLIQNWNADSTIIIGRKAHVTLLKYLGHKLPARKLS